MKIFGDVSGFVTHVKAPGVIFGYNDVLSAGNRTVTSQTSSFFGPSHRTTTIEPKLYLHIPNTLWSTFTGKLREYFLPWRWKTAYLDAEDGTACRRILVCTNVEKGDLSDRLIKMLGQSWFITNLIAQNFYREEFGQEFIRGSTSAEGTHKVAHSLGEWYGVYKSTQRLSPIYRSRGVSSFFKYFLLKHLSSSWKEVDLRIAGISEKVLIKKDDQGEISKLGLINQN